MADASYVQSSFLGGEVSQFFQGRYDRPDYRTFMNVCSNGHPVEAGAWTRRAGTMFAGTTRGGARGRTVKFDFQAVAPYTIEFTDGWLRFRAGTQWAITNDSVGVTAISAANPAVLQTAAVVTWATGNTLTFGNLGTTAPLLQNRQFLATKIDTTHFSLQDALTLATIDGSTLGAIAGTATVARIQEVASPYAGGSWGTVRVVQAETTAVMLQGAVPPQLLQVTTLPAAGVSAQFSLSGLTFLDGPYLDPFTNGVQATPSALSGNISLSLAFPAYSATKAYKVGDFVTSVAINYISLTDDNVNNTPAGSPSNWATTSAGAAINNGQGFLGTDVGRLVRLYSEPPIWAVGTAYVVGNFVTYNPSGLPGANTYWRCLVNNTGNIPGSDTVNWALATNAALWSWGKITGLSTQISGSLAGSVNIGTMTSNGGLAAAFDGVSSKPDTTSAAFSIVTTSTVDSYVGKNYSGASAQKIASVAIYPSNNFGFGTLVGGSAPVTFVINLRAKATAPGSASDGTLLGTTGSIPNQVSAVSITSSDQVTTWNFVWIEIVGTFNLSGRNLNCENLCAQVVFFSPTGTGSGSGINIELLGPPLLYTNPVITWRLGAYSNTTGWPTNGTYAEGRIWLAGAIPNRGDSSVSNGLVGTTLNFAPTDQNGVVAASNAITFTVNSDGVNPILWMAPDLQGIIMGTLAGEWLVSAPTAGPLAPTNIAARRVTRIGCANIEPRRTEHTLAFVQRFSRKIMEYFADVYSGKFSAPNLAERAMHITKPGVAELAYTQAVMPCIWGRNADGSWFGCTYKRDTLSTSTGPTFAGFHRHLLGSGRTVESITAGPSVGGNLDALTMVTSDGITRHVEIMTDVPEEGATLAQASYLDDAVNPTSVTTSSVTPAPYGGVTLNGLWHLNGKTVQAWCGGLDCGLQENGSFVDFVVTNGSIVIPYGDGISAGSAKGQFTAAFAAGLSLSQMLVGYTFTSQGQSVRPNAPGESGARNGPAFGKKRRNHQYAAQTEGTQAVSFGATFATAKPALFKSAGGVTLALTQQFSGIHWDMINDDYSFDGMLAWQVTRPYPCNIPALGGFLQTQDK
jgi:hypothetical protein